MIYLSPPGSGTAGSDQTILAAIGRLGRNGRHRLVRAGPGSGSADRVITTGGTNGHGRSLF
jgi:hypothetical protein